MRLEPRSTGDGRESRGDFAELRGAGELGLVAYITAGDPSLAATRENRAGRGGGGRGRDRAGRAVQRSGGGWADDSARERTGAAELELRWRACWSWCARLRRKTDVPLVLFSYFNPILQMGLEQFARKQRRGGRRRRAGDGFDAGRSRSSIAR